VRASRASFVKSDLKVRPPNNRRDSAGTAESHLARHGERDAAESLVQALMERAARHARKAMRTDGASQTRLFWVRASVVLARAVEFAIAAGGAAS